jgi:hypothetical protein
VGHEDPFPPHRLNAGCPFSYETLAGTHGNGRDAPIPVVPWNRLGSPALALMITAHMPLKRFGLIPSTVLIPVADQQGQFKRQWQR